MDFDDVAEEWGCCDFDRNETELVGHAANDTEQSVLESVNGFGWTDEDMEIWVKYGLSPAYLREMRKIEERLLGEHVCTTRGHFRGSAAGRLHRVCGS